MTTASVGFHCPDCTRTGAQKVYRARDLQSKPTFVYAVIALCVLAFFGQVSSGSGNWQDGRVYFDGVLFGPFVQDGDYWRIVTTAFLHAGTFHLLLNMYALYIFAPIVQRIVGLTNTALIYAGGLFGGSAAVLLFDFNQATLGASGAVLGLAGGLAGVMVARGMDLRQTNLMGIFAINLLLPLVFPISFWGHFGGIAGGFAVGWVVSAITARDRRRSSQATAAAAGVVVALVVLAVVGAAIGTPRLR